MLHEEVHEADGPHIVVLFGAGNIGGYAAAHGQDRILVAKVKEKPFPEAQLGTCQKFDIGFLKRVFTEVYRVGRVIGGIF